MRQVLIIAMFMFSASVIAQENSAKPDILHETMIKSEYEKPQTLNRIRDAIKVGKSVSSTSDDADDTSVETINSFSDFFEKRVKASNH